MHSRPPIPTARRTRAFTLIEVITALAVLSLAVPAMLWSIRDSTRRRVDPVLLSRARWLAAERLETCIADGHSPSRGYTYLVNGNYATESPVAGFTGMSRSVSIVETAANFSAGTGWKTITVTVSYTDGGGISRSLSLATVLTSYTP